MNKYFLIALIFIRFTGYAQNASDSIVDSLITIVSNPGKTAISIADVNQSISTIYSNNMPDNAAKFLYLLTQIEGISAKRGTKKDEALANYHLGIFHIAALTGYAKAIPPLLKGLTIFEEINDSMGVSKCYMQLGLIGYVTQYYEDALKNFALSLRYANNYTSTFLMAITLTELKKYDEAEKLFLKVLSSFKKENRIKNMSECYLYLGKLYQDKGEMDTAHYYLKLALQNLKLHEGQIELGRPFAMLSAYFLQNNNVDSAKVYALKTLDAINEYNDEISAMIATETLSKVYEKEGAYQKAHHYLRRHYIIKYEKVQGSTQQKIAELQGIFEFKRRLAEENQKHQEELRKKNRTKNIFLISGMFVLLISGGLWSRLNFLRKSRTALEVEKNNSENLLLNILPHEIAQELKEKGKAAAKSFDVVSILFTDFKDFTEYSAKLSATELVDEIGKYFEAFDGITEKYGIEKIKTIGDAYMAAGGLPVPTDESVKNTVLAALEMQAFIEERKNTQDAKGFPAFEMRVGIHTGPVVAGIVGVKKFQYDIWGDTVNTANRMETYGQVGKVNISQATYQLLKNDPDFTFENRGKIEAKGKGEMEMWFVGLK